VKHRVGIGFDVHRLEPGRACILGGVRIPYPSGPAGHSDGDAVLHALADAILGAAGLDDLGTLFVTVLGKVRALGWSVANADIVIATEGPRIAPHRAAMRSRIAELLGVEIDAVNLKGKSLEGLGPLAGGAGIAVQAVCLLTA
jgi:2-C-methyl-D-erythritol 2,4-cyclodiphosphate synthase